MLWSMALLLSQRATPEDEAELVEASRERTVAQMKRWLAERAAKQAAESGSGEEPRAVATKTLEDEDESPRTLRIRVSKEELLVVEASRRLIETLDGARPTDEHLLNALIGEGESALLDLAGRRIARLRVPELDPDRLEALRENLRRLRARREARAEAKIPIVTAIAFELEETPLPTTPRELDAESDACARSSPAATSRWVDWLGGSSIAKAGAASAMRAPSNTHASVSASRSAHSGNG